MKIEGRRTSKNVDDRRMSGGKVAAVGGGGITLIGVVIYFLTGNTGALNLAQAPATQQCTTCECQCEKSTDKNCMENCKKSVDPEQERLAHFSSVILASTEDVWTTIFSENQQQYIPPKLVLFSKQTHSKCGQAQSETGPFYCPADQTVYIDLAFFMDLKKFIGVSGDFAYAYIIAHEVGHHVQYLTGTMREVNRLSSMGTKQQANELSVRQELQADFYAGVWAHHEKQRFQSITDQDIKLAQDAAGAVGDDSLGHSHETFTHGSAEQRARYFKAGMTTGRRDGADHVYTVAYSQL